MPVADPFYYHPQDGIYPEALLLRNATISELFHGLWTPSQRYRARRERLADRYRRWANNLPPVLGMGSADELPLAVNGPCLTQDVCCMEGTSAIQACNYASACGCKVIRHAQHPGQHYSYAVQLEAETHTASVLAN